MVELSIALGIIISLFLIESFGLAAGGIVVPGYVALQLIYPDRMLGTLVISLLTLGIIYVLSNYTFLYGRRQMVLALLIGSILSIISHKLMFFNVETTTLEFSAIGWVVPGLIAHTSFKQGVVKTLAMLALTAIIVRLAVILLYGGELFPELY